MQKVSPPGHEFTCWRYHNIVFLTLGMQNVIAEKGYTMETDTIMGFLNDNRNGLANVTFTRPSPRLLIAIY